MPNLRIELRPAALHKGAVLSIFCRTIVQRLLRATKHASRHFSGPSVHSCVPQHAIAAATHAARAAPAQDTARLQKKITAFEAEVKLKQTLVSKLEADLAKAREACRAEAELDEQAELPRVE